MPRPSKEKIHATQSPPHAGRVRCGRCRHIVRSRRARAGGSSLRAATAAL
ncbi:MJ0042-type zinc finger domain-containing protein [Phyllobacterium sp. 21LDTY02-6]